MRNIFVINPMAGKRGSASQIKKQIMRISDKLLIPVEVYETQWAGDGEVFVRQSCRKRKTREVIRFYACGGDGLLNEVANGAFGYENVQVGCIPLGTGNDYVRNYGSPGSFLDIEAQLKGAAVDTDLIQYKEEREGGDLTCRYCINMFNIGFDCNVVDQTSRAKHWPLVKGSFAYLLSVAIILIKKKGADLRVCYEDGSFFDGRLLLIAVANGCYCGGGVKGIPLSDLDDGLMDVSLIKDVPRRTFIRLFPKYAKGTHLQDKKAEAIIDYRKCKSITIIPNGKKMRLCIDGEIKDAGKVTFKIVPKALRFIIPKDL